VDLDVLSFPVAGGFRGFQNLLAGYHHVRVHGGAAPMTAEVVLTAPGSVVVLSGESGALVVADLPEVAEQAAHGAMRAALIDPLPRHMNIGLGGQQAASWLDVPASQVKVAPPPEGAEPQAVRAQHSDVASALRELQAAFVRAVCLGEQPPGQALNRLLQAYL